MPKKSPPNLSPHDAMTDPAFPVTAVTPVPSDTQTGIAPSVSSGPAALAARLRAPLTVGGRTVPGRLWLA
ncbi:tRNA-dihydrouridine synthase family protein, partial [Desulfovibrio oxamicus]|nr:tRNA-dihydrouridine synthase family protein [Nitratidesulfovibrio oxamicus]